MSLEEGMLKSFWLFLCSSWPTIKLEDKKCFADPLAYKERYPCNSLRAEKNQLQIVRLRARFVLDFS